MNGYFPFTLYINNKPNVLVIEVRCKAQQTNHWTFLNRIQNTLD